MARIRSIKPEFCTSEQIADCSPLARLLFICMWMFCDDGGVHLDSTKRLKMECFPGDAMTDEQVGDLVEELIRAGLLRRFSAENGHFLYVTGWDRHQKIERPTPRKYPSPPDDVGEPSPSPHRAITEPSPLEGKGMESKGKDIAPTNVGAARATRVPDISEILTWIEEGCAARQRHGLPELDLRLEAERFWNYWQAKPGAAGRKLSWSGTWINWALRSEPPKGTGNGRRDTSGANAIAAGFANALAKRSADRGGDYDAAEPLRLIRPASGSA